MANMSITMRSVSAMAQATAPQAKPQAARPTATMTPMARDGVQKQSFAAKHPVLRTIGFSWAACSGAGALGMVGGYALGTAIQKGAIRVGEKALIQGQISGVIVGTLAAGAVGLIGGAMYAHATRRH